MERSILSWVCVFALVALPVGGCSDETTAAGGSGGSGDTGGNGGVGGMPECESPDDCDDGNECTGRACGAGVCEFPPVADGTACDEDNECSVGMCAEGICPPVADDTPCGDDAGTCQQGSCRVACDEQGIRDAIAAGGGPYTFDCDGPTVVGTTITIDNDVILDGEGNLTVDGGGGNGSGVDVTEGVTATLSGVTIQGSSGAIDNRGALTLTNVVLTDNHTCEAQAACAAVVYTNGQLTITDSTVSNNEFGILFVAARDLTVIRTTIADNETSELFLAAGTTLIQESTISGNRGYAFATSGPLTLIDSTVSGNISISGNVTVINSTIVGSVAVSARGGSSIRGSVISGACESGVTSLGYNIESPGNTCGFDQGTDQVDVTEGQLNLGPLQDNGGPTMTHALLPGSVAIDVIPADMCEVGTDQRGVDRPQGTMCDVGAFELEP